MQEIGTPDATNRVVTLQLLGLGLGSPNLTFERNSFYIPEANTDDHYTLNYDGRTWNGEPTSITQNLAVKKYGTLQLTQLHYIEVLDAALLTRPAYKLIRNDYAFTSLHKYYQRINLIVYHDIQVGSAANKFFTFYNVIFQNDNTKISTENGSQVLSLNFEYCAKI